MTDKNVLQYLKENESDMLSLHMQKKCLVELEMMISPAELCTTLSDASNLMKSAVNRIQRVRVRFG